MMKKVALLGLSAFAGVKAENRHFDGRSEAFYPNAQELNRLQIVHMSCDYNNQNDKAYGRKTDDGSDGFMAVIHVMGAVPGNKVGIINVDDDDELEGIFEQEVTCAEWDNNLSVFPWVDGVGDIDESYYYKTADEDGYVAFRVELASCDNTGYVMATQSAPDNVPRGTCESSDIVEFGNLIGVHFVLELTEFPSTFTITPKMEMNFMNFFARVLAPDRDHVPWKNDELAQTLEVNLERDGTYLTPQYVYVTNAFEPESIEKSGALYAHCIIPCVEGVAKCTDLMRQMNVEFAHASTHDKLTDYVGDATFHTATAIHSQLLRITDDNLSEGK